uniref:Uncharacterized protein n=1 Tax=Lactuca sativa TaxID=4236 RepID=A0A9R1V287_LACSA|nr:hypothetical protein LSAT_V11C700383410 [Lactuca sativa]
MMPLHSAIASASRSALMSAPKHVPISPFSSSTRTLPREASRIVVALGMVESMMPLHSAIAFARLKSSLAVDSACWPTLVDEGDEWWRTVSDDGNYGCVVPFNIGSNGWDRIGDVFKKPMEKT